MPINKEQGAGLPARIDRLSRTDKFGCAVGELESGVSKNSARGPGSAKRAPIRLSSFFCLLVQILYRSEEYDHLGHFLSVIDSTEKALQQ